MTLIARFTVNGWPVLIGDLLLSGKPLPTTKIALPTLRDIEDVFSASDETVPRNLKQKISIIGENVVIGWAGISQTAADVIGTLVRKSTREQFTTDSLYSHFSSLPQTVWNEIGMTGFILEGKMLNAFGRGNSFSNYDTTVFRNVGLLGSGSGDLLKTFVDTRVEQRSEGPFNKSQIAVLMGLTKACNALGWELANYESLKQFYGGGYEVGSLLDGKFQKIDNIMYFVWEATIDEHNNVEAHPSHASHYKYHNENLIIGDIAIEGTSASEMLVPISPVHEEWDPGEPIPESSYDPEWLCNAVLIRGSHFKGVHLMSDLFRQEAHKPSQIRIS